MLPGILSAEEEDKKTAIDELDGWTPPARVYEISNIGRNVELEGEKLRCYTVEEGRQVLLPMFADYRSLWDTSRLWVAAKAEFENKISLLENKIDLQANQIAFYQDESEHWYKVSLVKENKLRNVQKWAWVPWSLLVVENLVVGVLGVVAIGNAAN